MSHHQTDYLIIGAGAAGLAFADTLLEDTDAHQKLLPSGRVSYHPMSDYLGDGRFVSLLSGAQTEVTVRKRIVDATYYSPAIPSTHKPKYRVTEGVRMVPPNALPGLWQHGGDRQTHNRASSSSKSRWAARPT